MDKDFISLAKTPQDPLFTLKTDCRGCFKCLRECKVKTIAFEGNSVKILPDECIYCGDCVDICPVNSNKIREDIDNLIDFLKLKGNRAIAMLSPSFISEYGQDTDYIIENLKKIGFEFIYDFSFGVDLMYQKSIEYLCANKNKINILPFCPSVNELVKKYYPKYVKYIIPVLSPAKALSKYLKNKYGQNVATVFIGSCIAEKKESIDNDNYLDYAITFKELNKKINYDRFLKNEPTKAIDDSYFIKCNYAKNHIRGNGFADYMKCDNFIYLPQTGLSAIIKAIDIAELEKEGMEKNVLFELSACQGGCINGAGAMNSISPSTKKIRIALSQEDLSNDEFRLDFDISNIYNETPIKKLEFKEKQITGALAFVGMFKHSDYKNCGGCGYDTCLDFSVAMLNGKAKPSMCIAFNQKLLAKYKDKDKELQNNLFFHQEIIDAVPVPIYYRDKNGAYLGCNNAYEKFSNRNRKEIIGKKGNVIHDKEFADMADKMDQRLLTHGGVQTFDTQRKIKDNNQDILKDIVVSKAAFRNKKQEIEGVVGAIFDITDRKNARRKLEIAMETSELSTQLLRKMPSGFVIVSNDLKIINSNYAFAELIGEDATNLFEFTPGLEGALITSLIPFHNLFSSILKSGIKTVEKDIQYKNKYLKISLFTISKNKVVGAIILDMSIPEIRKEEVSNRVVTVVKENLETVQKIAYLLGENASQTERMLNSITELFDSK